MEPIGVPAAPPAPASDPTMMLMVGLAVGYGYYWLATRGEGLAGDEEGEAEEDEDVADAEVERPRSRRLADVTTDSLIDRPAVLASSGRPGDCYKAVKLLPASAGLAQTQSEKKIFRRVLKAVATDCRHAEEAVDDALEDMEDTREEIESMLNVDTSSLDTDVDKRLVAMKAAQRAIVEGSLTRTKRKKIPKNQLIDDLDRTAHARGASARGGRPRGPAIQVTRQSGQSYRLRKEKAPTKRGFKWRKEES